MKDLKTRSRITLLFFVVCFKLCHSQNIRMEGHIRDLNEIGLSNANITAENLSNKDVKFAFANNEGIYRLVLNKNQSYKLTISHLGYKTITQTIILFNDDTLNFNLEPTTEILDEVNLNYTTPVVIKEDTITYRVNSFISGNENKLREILNKLPAMTVDRDGNVTVKGKKVTKLLVEGEVFFTGDTKLGVNNIPADAVDRIEVYENYNNISLLKGLEESDDIALNIKLKEDKKKFVFGDIGAAVGHKERYSLNPSLYYYSPEIKVNFIGELNNIGEKSFTLKDYLSFEGGINKLLDDPRSYFSLYDSEFAKLLANKDQIDESHKFLGLNINKTYPSKHNLNGYAIFVKSDGRSLTENRIEYPSLTNLIETRSISEIQSSLFGLGKIEFKRAPKNDVDFRVDSHFNISGNKFNRTINSIFIDNNSLIAQNTKPENLSLKTATQWSKRFNNRHTISSYLNLHNNYYNLNNQWDSNQPFLDPYLPLENSERYKVDKIESKQSNSFDLFVKHYWTLNKKSQFDFSFRNNLRFEKIETNEFQELDNQKVVEFSDYNFGNNSDLSFRDTSIEIFYKYSKKNVIFKPAISYTNFSWNFDSFGDNIKQGKYFILPKLLITIKSLFNSKITFKYIRNSYFPEISQLADRFTIVDFNKLYKGNSSLENTISNNFSLNVNRFSLYRDLYYNISMGYSKKEKNIKNNITLENINILSNPMFSNFKDESITINGNVKKGINSFLFSTNWNIELAKYENIINENVFLNNSRKFRFGGSVKSRFKNAPNFEMAYSKIIVHYEQLSKTKFKSDDLTLLIDYEFLKDFKFKSDYTYQTYSANEQKNYFNFGNAALGYHKENSLWSFELKVNNIFDLEYRKNNSRSDLIIYDRKTFLFPRTILFKTTIKI